MMASERRLRLIRFILTGALAAGALPAMAGVRPEFTPPDATSWYGWRSFRFRPAFAFKDVGYDSNVFLRSDSSPDSGPPSSPGSPAGDFTATLSPSGQGLVQFGSRGFLTMKAGLDYVWFSHYSSQTHVNYILGLRGNLVLGDLRVLGETEYQKHDERPSNEIDQRTRRTNALLREGLGYEYSPATAIDLIFSQEQIGYSDKDFANIYPCLSGTPENPFAGCPVYYLGDLLSRVERTATLRFVNKLAGRTQLVVNLSDRTYDFTGPMPDPALYEEIPVVGPVRDTDERRLMAGFEFLPGGPLYGTVLAGVTDFSPVVLTDQQTRQAVWAADLFWRIRGRVLLQGTTDKNFYFSTYGQNVYYQQNHLALQSVFYLNRFFGLEAAYERFRLLYPVVDPTMGPLYDSPRTDFIRTIGCGLRMKLKEHSVAALRLSRRRRVSNLPGINDREFLITTGVETTF